jgi:hypothetical protein
MAGNQIPVLRLDIDEENIRRLDEISEKFKAAFGMGPAGFTVNAPSGQKAIPGDNHKPPAPKNDTPTNVPKRDNKGRFVASGAAKPPTPKLGGVGESDFEKFLKQLNKNAQGTLKTFGLINRTLGTTTTKLKGLFSTTLSWGTKLLALSVAGPFGYGLMAGHASNQNKNAQGMNVTTGQMKAASSVYGPRISGIDNIMQTLAAAQNDPSSDAYRGLMSLGINPRDGAGENLPKFMTKMTGLLEQYKGSGVSQTVLNARGLGWVGVNTANQIAANGKDIPQFNKTYEERTRKLDGQLSPGTLRGYQFVSSNLSYNADRIGNTFLNALSKLSPSITRFSDSITAGLEKFINGGSGKAAFETVASGLNKLATWLGSESFKRDMDEFSLRVKEISTAIGNAIKFISGNSKLDGADKVSDIGERSGRWARDKLRKYGLSLDWWTFPDERNSVEQHAQSAMAPNWSKGTLNQNLPSGGVGNIKDFVANTNDAAKLPKGMMSAIAETESSWNSQALNKKSGAAGLWQFIPATRKAYGLSEMDVFDPQKSTGAVVKYLQSNMKRYDGDIAKTLTQYNGGRFDKNGNISAKMETINYLMKTLPHIQGGLEQHPGIMRQLTAARDSLANAPKDARVTIDVNQKPGSDLAVQVAGISLVRG